MMILEPMNRSNTMDWRGAVREGVYPVAFAAKLAETTNSRVASWFRAPKGSKLAPAILTPFPPVEGDVKGVAAWYDTGVDDVTQAVAFQQRLAA
jgi:hypothetical protein